MRPESRAADATALEAAGAGIRFAQGGVESPATAVLMPILAASRREPVGFFWHQPELSSYGSLKCEGGVPICSSMKHSVAFESASGRTPNRVNSGHFQSVPSLGSGPYACADISNASSFRVASRRLAHRAGPQSQRSGLKGNLPASARTATKVESDRSATSGSRPYRVLSLDGGGMRGAYAAAYLDRMASAGAKSRGVGDLDVGAGFDMIVGTSSGGIIACALAMGIPPREVVALYREHGSKVFGRKLPQEPSIWELPKFVGDLLWRRKSLIDGENALRHALRSMLGETTMADIYEKRGIALVVTAVEMSRHAAWVFKTPHLAGTNRRDSDDTLVDVCLSTTAAPVYRSIADIVYPDGRKSRRMFVDGGLWANNPAMVGLIEALDVAASDQPIEVFCLGTCPKPAGEDIESVDIHRGVLGWLGGGRAAMLAIDAQQFAYDHMAKKLAKQIKRDTDRDCTVLRFPTETVSDALGRYLELDDARPKATNALVRQAESDADMTNSKFAYQETDHEAALICNLFGSMPELTDPPNRRTVLPRNGPLSSTRG